MMKIAMIAIWIGPLPNTFELWKYSVLQNATIDFYLITDQTEVKEEGNLRVLYKSLHELKEQFQQLCGSKITLEFPYKLCEYKPLWGPAFSEIIEGYDFWGHLDLDVILGDIRVFMTDELLVQYDKILEAGWFTLYRNTEEMRYLYKRSMEKDNMAYPYKAAFKNKYACYFDEYMGMNILAWTYDYKVFRDQLIENVVQDFGWQTLEFRSYITKDNFIFYWKEGKLYRYLCDVCGNLVEASEKEYMVVHIQKRKMEISFSNDEFLSKKSMWIVPNRFQMEKPTEMLYNEQERQQYESEIKKRDTKKRLRNLRQFGLISYIPHYFRSRRIKKWIVREKGFF